LHLFAGYLVQGDEIASSVKAENPLSQMENCTLLKVTSDLVVKKNVNVKFSRKKL
jgi:hypothetical protein